MSFLDKKMGWVFIPSKSESYRLLKQNVNISFWDEYYESSVRECVDKLLRKGKVEMRKVGGETEVRITDIGKTEIIKREMEKLGIVKPKKWDGKWRMVFFDVEELRRGRRDLFRRWLIKLGLRRMQKSVWVYPYPLEREIKFLREILEVPHDVKLVTAEIIENDKDLRDWFDL